MKYLFIALLLFVTQSQAENIVKVPTPGTLSTLLTQLQKDTCTQLTIQGKLNSADIRVLRQMAGYKEEGCSTGVLSTLNLADAEFVTDKEPYMVLDAMKEKLLAVAVSAKEGELRLNMGESLQNKHIIDYNERYRGRVWMDYSDYKGRAGDTHVLNGRTDLMPTKWSGSAYSYGMYFLGRGADRRFNTQREQFIFSDNFNAESWKALKKRGIAKFKCHKLIQDGDRYLLQAYCHKDFLPDDMFYGCESLKRVILPSGIRVNNIVKDETSQIEYRIPYDELTIRYFSKGFKCGINIPPNWLDGSRKQEKQIYYSGAETKMFINLLHNIEPMPSLPENYTMNTRARFFVEYADGSAYENYYLDMVNKCILKLKNGEKPKFFVASKELLDEMNRLGISTSPVKRETLDHWE